MASTSSIQAALKQVNESIQNAVSKRSQGRKDVRLVAVTKVKPVEDILAAYQCGQRHFGENYMNELEDKSKDQRIVDQCKEIKWHFIGHLQSNKAKKFVAIPNMYMLETVHSAKIAQTVQREMEKAGKTERLKVFVQVNTSDEDNKNGVPPAEAHSLVSLILSECPQLEFVGLMTIGAFDHSIADGENPDFIKLIECRKEVCKKLNLSLDDVELSMGMSNDYEHAIELGSTNVRVGSTIFGARAPPKQTKPGEDTQPTNAKSGPSQEQHLGDPTQDSPNLEMDEDETEKLQKLKLAC